MAELSVLLIAKADSRSESIGFNLLNASVPGYCSAACQKREERTGCVQGRPMSPLGGVSSSSVLREQSMLCQDPDGDDDTGYDTTATTQAPL